MCARAAPDATIEIPGAPPLLTGAKSVDPELVSYAEETAAIRLALMAHRDVEQVCTPKRDLWKSHVMFKRGLLIACADIEQVPPSS